MKLITIDLRRFNQGTLSLLKKISLI